MFPFEKIFTNSVKSLRAFRLILFVAIFATSLSVQGNATTCIFTSKIIASNNPIGSCPIGTDTIIIKDTLLIDIAYAPVIGGVPFDGKFIVDGGTIVWSSNVAFTLGENARILLYNGGHLSPGLADGNTCNGLKTIFFDVFKLASCSGANALHSFADVNAAGCFDGTGICCDASMTVLDNSGNPNDRTLCQPGDSVTLSVLGSGTLGYEYVWTPGIGLESGPYKVPQFVNTTYTISISATFDPSGSAPAYVLTCGNSATVKINPQINLLTTITPVPCASSAVGAVDLTPSGGTPPYKFLWSNGKTTEDINTLIAGSYTVTITDAKGCTASKVSTVTTFDNTPPVISCPGNANGIASSGLCTTTIPNINAVFSDNCPSAQLSYKVTGATLANGLGQLSNTFPFQTGLNNVEYQVSDGSNVVSCFFNVTVVDNQLPTASNPPNITGIQCYGDLPLPDPSVVTTEADNCGTPTVTYVSESALGGFSCPGNPLVVSRRYRVTDASGNSINVIQLLLVADSTPPVFTQVPSDTTITCQTVLPVGTVKATDNCRADVVLTYLGETRTNGPCADTYTLTRTWRAQDNCGNTATAAQVINVQDLTKPGFLLVPANITVNCQSVPSVGTATATDNCDAAVTITFLGETRTNGACPDSYSLTRTWKADDNCGNSETATQVITVQDVSSPTFSSVPANITVSCESIPAIGVPVASDNCDASVTITYQGETRIDGACLDTYILKRSWKAEDNCGNTTLATQQVTVRDITVPSFTSIPANVTVSCESIPALGVPAATDNCDASVSITYDGETRTNGSCLFSYTLKRQWTATDNCGNTQTSTQIITVQDLVKPVFAFVPPNVTVSCEALPAVGIPSATDNCDPIVTITYVGETRENGVCLNTYLLRRHWIATDQCGNTNTAEQVITVQDLTPPDYTFVPDPITVSCDAIPAVGTPTATDNCDVSVSIVYIGETRTDGVCPNNYQLSRKWTATDNCGNTTSATQIITVQDITAPVFTSVPVGVTASCELLPVVGTPVASDNCSANVIINYLGEFIPGSGGCPGNYAIIRTWSAQDACGNSSTATQAITVQDITPPLILTVPADVTVSCANLPAAGIPTASDNCDATPTITFKADARTNGNCPHNYILRRQWSITDDCGNSSVAVQTITVQDITPPMFTSVPGPITVSCESIPAVDTPEASDDCAANVNITYNGATRIDGLCPDSYILQRTWTAIDSCGNTATALQIITVQDLTAPTFTFVPAPATVDCDNIPTPGIPTATDNCDATVNIQYTGEQRIDGTCPNNYTLLRIWISSDNCGNTTQASQLITVRDITAPVFTAVPAPITVSCDAIPVPGSPIATDNCTANVNITYLGESRTNGDCSGNYTLTRVWVAQDQCSNNTITNQVITVQDITNPVVTTIPANVTVSCSEIPAVGTPTATDNCDADLSITYNGATRVNGACPNSYTLTRKWTITDDCGNTASAVQILQVEDVTPPVFTIIPAATTVSCESIPAVASPAAFDNCAASVSITYTGEVRTDGLCPDSYTLKRSWVARDSCGNTSTAEQIITVQDLTPPNFTLIPSDVVVNCESVPVVTFPTAADNCDAFVNISYSGQVRIDGTCAHNYLLRREWVATDNCGNSSKATQVITVQDITAPQFLTVPQNITVSCESIPALGTPTANDNCDGNTPITFSGETRTDGNCPNNYILKRTWTAQDDCGNSRTAFQTITVQDLTHPVFTFVPAPETVNCDDVPAPGIPTATDNCSPNPSIVFVGETIMNSASPDSYTLERKWTVTDECGNVTTATQLLTVQDTIAPTIQCPTNITLDANGATCTGIATFNAPVTADNCSATLNLVSSASSGQDFPIGTTTVLMTVNDPTGNQASCTFQITVKDTTAPVLTNCPQDVTITTDPASCEIAVTWTAPIVTDPCDQTNLVTTVNIPTGTVLPTGIYPITYTAVDTSGNSLSCSFTVTVREDVPPVLIDCPANISVNTDTCDATVTWTAPTATDNCTTTTIVSSIASGTVFPETSTTVQYTATDGWGNTATCTFTVTVIDIVPPTFSGCPDDFVVDAGECMFPVSWVQPTATDNCAPNPTVYSIPEPGADLPSGYTTVHVYVVDPSGNQDTCTFVVEVIGPPIGLTNLPVNQSFIDCFVMPTWTPPTPTGICGPYTLESNYEPGDTFNIGVTTVTYTLTDTLNHVVTTSFTVTVTESIPPQFICPVSPIQVNISGAILSDPSAFVTGTDTISTCDGVQVQFLYPLATDNCSIPLVTQVGGSAADAVFNLGIQTLTFKATDDAGNTALCSLQIEVLPLMPLNPQVSDVIGCKGDEITLSATPITGAIYIWNGPRPPYPDNNNIVIPDLEGPLTGYYTVVANINGCITPLDSALVRIGLTPNAEDDTNYEVATNEVLADFNVLLNDTYELDDYTLTITNPQPGLIDHGNGLYSYEAGNENKVIYFIYKLCSKACPELCDEGIISIAVRERICSTVPNIITPNGDDINDYLMIPCLDIEPYPLNRLVIYNQWGDKVYEAAPYSNAPDKAWRGEFMGEPGKGLPDAAYYFIFKATPEDKGLNGFIEVFR
jgi:gliding motility-associated-like protein